MHKKKACFRFFPQMAGKWTVATMFCGCQTFGYKFNFGDGSLFFSIISMKCSARLSIYTRKELEKVSVWCTRALKDNKISF